MATSELRKQQCREYQARVYKKTPHVQINKDLVRKYGITVWQWMLMMIEQDGLCKLCRVPITVGKGSAVDHCHKTNKVRGLLCFDCNTGLGKFRENPELLRQAAEYLML